MAFSMDLIGGSIGEAYAWDFLMKQSNVCDVFDVRDDEQFRQMDVDFLVKMTDKSILWAEVKCDTMADRTGNIAYELTTSGHIGCLAKTKAQIILYFIVNTQELVIFKIDKLRSLINRMSYERRRMGDSAEGFLVPIKDMKFAKIYKLGERGEWKAKDG